MAMNCPPGSYYDEAVGRCEGCHTICYGSNIYDSFSDCSRFCPEMMNPKPDDPPDLPSVPGQLSVTDILLIVFSTAVVVSLLVGVMIWRLRRRQQMSHDQESPTNEIIEHCQENTPVQVQEEEGFTDLHIPQYEHNTNDRLLTSTSL